MRVRSEAHQFKKNAAMNKRVRDGSSVDADVNVNKSKKHHHI